MTTEEKRIALAEILGWTTDLYDPIDPNDLNNLNLIVDPIPFQPMIVPPTPPTPKNSASNKIHGSALHPAR